MSKCGSEAFVETRLEAFHWADDGNMWDIVWGERRKANGWRGGSRVVSIPRVLVDTP